ncbi:MAG: nicotinamide mononucleotide deamidase-related protein [Desulfurococcales archaeon]|nr:nicotinamide mononucleotide deamidase-related protein [Desulfurococcales archaeon]
MDNGEPRAWIVTVGNEILIGRIVNTNAAWLAEKLTFMGFRVERIIVVPDEPEHIAEELRRALGRARVVITTGGLGPTYDDRTLEGVAKSVSRSLKLNPEALEMVRRFYERRGLELTEDRMKMALLPEGAEAIPNPVGAAPGSWLEVEGTIIVSLPGVPAEMKAMFEQHVEPRLAREAPRKALHECGVIVRGVPESGIAPYLKRIARKYPHAYIKSHPKGHETDRPILDIRVLASAPTREEARSLAERIIAEIEETANGLGGQVEREPC